MDYKYAKYYLKGRNIRIRGDDNHDHETKISQLPNALLGCTASARNTLWHDRATRRSCFPFSRGQRFRIFAIFDFLDPNFALYELVNVRHHNRTLYVHERERWCGIAGKRGVGVEVIGWINV